jgi:glycerol-3-phosphate dehydrogenase
VTIGTTDTLGGDIDNPVAGEEDISYLLRHVNGYMRCHLTEKDVISTWAGYRPLVSPRKAGVSSARLSRSHVVLDSQGGMVTIVGGKLTTYRRMAQDTVDHIARRLGTRTSHVTEQMPLAGSEGWEEALEQVRGSAATYDLRPDTVRRLGAYGSSALDILHMLDDDPTLARRVVADLPYIMAEVVFACRYEMAVQLDDVLARRLHVTIEDWSHGLEAAEEVAAVMSPELGWDTAQAADQVARYRETVLREDPSRVASPDAVGAGG